MTPEDISDDDALFGGGLGLDSIDALEIVVMLESEFGIKLKNESSARDYFKSIASLADFVEQRLAQPK
jgi:acyl carrier protein